MSEETEEHVPQAKALTIDVDIPPQLSPGASSDTNSSSDDVKSIPEIVKPLIKAQDDITSVTSVSNIIKLDHFALISSWINQTKSYKSFLKIFTPPNVEGKAYYEQNGIVKSLREFIQLMNLFKKIISAESLPEEKYGL
ncbi:3376_t:CDS:2 [Gigaspora margarita]|uniref:3376_t:CDS:1 n=1 Tax=Gigaspora margarita TaxID=4874 RepID=A0ABM8W1X0_GIGMA|nr:3376_t:CDS:2 [Gigaspora margarita]